MRDRFATLKHLRTLDPKADHQTIHRISSDREFPWDYGRGLEVAIWRTCCVPRISQTLDGSSEFAQRAQKRYDDTRILLGEMVRGGYDSERGRQALRQINLAHRRFDIDNADMLYVLSTFVFEPVRWIDRWAWRRVSETERLAAFYFYTEIGRRMNIRDLPTDVDAFEEFNREYEREHFRPAPSNHRVGSHILRLYASWYPRPVSDVVAATLPCRLDTAAREALGMPEPPRWARALNSVGLKGHAAAERVAPASMARLMTRPTARTYPGYPRGYRIADIGPEHARADHQEQVIAAGNDH
ncbi:oxygenase MpaB family protein [Streptomyces sp. WI04-05B]|uniref:oxygenase MpaB family protein n=1 Tax=Streptomyces TaxID=1883 RepID=UPI0029AB1083|nr:MULTISPECIES: oxygenase MpaB family protein [unclassified Streptomyces]MDX2547311.1 oxygenase MpaB family protein [Streptomyces sp. WI04-05B]MDX2589799.1 oxygenase MpaB family protein [Streptomyces sp. WI04-05A]MDX3753464.1 oxygenase MpaB family protein [Streptomyces sp. AK08-02]